MEITKVRFHDESTTVHWQTSNLGTPEKHELNDCEDGRQPGFAEAIKAVQKDAVEALGLGEISDRYRLTQVSVSKDSNGRRGFILHGMFRTNHGEVALATPLRREPAEGATEGTLSDVELKRAQALLKEGEKFVGGERDQGDLFEGEPGDDTAEA